MANELLKDFIHFLADPGVPDTPPIPAWEEIVETTVWVVGPIIAWQSVAVFVKDPHGGYAPLDDVTLYVSGAKEPVVPFVYWDGFRNLYVFEFFPFYGVGHFETHYELINHPAVPGVPGRPPVWVNEYHIGWNAGARSVASLAGDGVYQFHVRDDAVGVVTGFNDVNVDANYPSIDFGIYCASGNFVVVEDGTTRTDPAPYVSSDVFAIARQGTQVTYYQNSTLVYTSLTVSVGTVFADASLYFGSDHIDNASLGDITAMYAGITGAIYDNLGGIESVASNLVAYVTDNLGEIISHGERGPEGSVADDLGDIESLGVGDGAATVDDYLELISYGAAGLFAPSFAAVNDQLGEIQAYAHGAASSSTADAGTIHDNLGEIRTHAFNFNAGVVEDYLGEIETLATNLAPAPLPSYATEELHLRDAVEEHASVNLVETINFTDAYESHSIFTNNMVERLHLDATLQSVVPQLVTATFALTNAYKTNLVTDVAEHLALNTALQLAGTFVNTVVEPLHLSAAQALGVSSKTVETLALTTALAHRVTSPGVIEQLALATAIVQTAHAVNTLVELLHFTNAIAAGPSNSVSDTFALNDISTSSRTITQTLEETAAFSDAAVQSFSSFLAEHLQLTTVTVVTTHAFSDVLEQLALADANLSTAHLINNLDERLFLWENETGGGVAGAWTSHLETFAMSRYEHFPFQSMAVVDGVLLGAADEGVYQLNGDDDAGVPIDAGVIHDWSDHLVAAQGQQSDPRKKRPRSFWVNGSGVVACAIGYMNDAGDDVIAGPYVLPQRMTGGGFGNNRVLTGRGIYSRYLQVAFRNIDGGGFSYTDALLEVDPMHRRL